MSPEAATHHCVFEICSGLECPNAQSNDSLFMQVTADPVSNNHEKVLFPALTANLGLIFSPYKGVITSSLLQVAIKSVHKLRIDCGMTLGAWMSWSSLGKTLMLSLLISFKLFTIAVAGHIQFGPVGTSLFVSAWFIFPDSFLALILGVILDFAVEAVFAIPVCVASGTRTETIAALWCPEFCFFGLFWNFVLLLFWNAATSSSSSSASEWLS